LSWFGAAACAVTTGLLLRRGSVIHALLAVLAVPLIAIRTRPRADMFTVVLFAAFLALLWRYHRTGRTRLWVLPLLMAAWVNLQSWICRRFGADPWVPPGGSSGNDLVAAPRDGGGTIATLLAVAGRYARRYARQSMWLGLYGPLLRQEGAVAGQLQWIPEWGAVPLNWTAISTGLSLRAPSGSFYLIPFTKGFTSLTGGEVTMLDNAITATDATLSWTFIEIHSVPIGLASVSARGRTTTRSTAPTAMTI
jgi:hypothetical protein